MFKYYIYIFVSTASYYCTFSSQIFQSTICAHFDSSTNSDCVCHLTPEQKSAAADAEETGAEASGHGTPHPSDVLDMPVDPNEPTYCLCHQVSYGEMIGCDNPDVSVQFLYHLFCAFVLIDLLSQFEVSDRVVPFCLRRPHDEAKGQVVLPEVLAGSQEEVKRRFGCRTYHRQCVCFFLNICIIY